MPDEGAPARKVLSELVPGGFVDVALGERLVQAARIRELWSARGAGRARPRREQFSRQTIKWHTRHVTGPAKLAPADVFVDRFQVEPPPQIRIRDALLPLHSARDRAHLPHALTVKHTQSIKESLGETPSLTAVQENRGNQTDI